MNRKPLGLYLHIPFCQSKCAYCDFYSMSGADEETMQRYTDALLLQMEDYSKAARHYTVDTVFIGGGTPSVLPAKCMGELIAGIHRNFSVSRRAEFTMECNPATVSAQTLQKYRRAGVNRLSMGLQSGEDGELRSLSRIHTKEEFEASYLAARKAGFENINIDIMYGIPMQTAESFARTINYAAQLSPEHISLYGLRIEEGTPFALTRDTLILPDEDTESEMYFSGIEMLKAAGYRQYEISNFARPGFECRHNLKYWNCEEYLGLGCAAHSYFADTRFSFKRNMGLFIDAMEADITGGDMLTDDGMSISPDSFKSAELVDEMFPLTPADRIGEYIMLRLRLTEGISSSRFERRFGMNFDALYGRRLKIYIDNGFMTYDGDCYAFTPRGMYVSNYILSSILDFDEQSHIIMSAADGTEC